MRLFGFLFLALMLAACSTEKMAARPTESEQLLETKAGPMRLVEQKMPDDPMQEHMHARGQVNPSPSVSNEGYTSTPTLEDMKEPMHFRVLKLERQMAGLQEDLNKLLPPLKSLAANDDQLDKTLIEIKEHQKAAAAEHVAQYREVAPSLPLTPPPPTPEGELEAVVETIERTQPMAAPEKAEPPLPATLPPVLTAGPGVTGVRIGDHPGKVRIVLDLSGPAKFTTDLDNNEKLLLINLPGMAWKAAASKTLKNKLIRGYTARAGAPGSGATVAIDLAGPVKLLNSMALPPESGAGHRIVVDIAAQ